MDEVRILSRFLETGTRVDPHDGSELNQPHDVVNVEGWRVPAEAMREAAGKDCARKDPHRLLFQTEHQSGLEEKTRAVQAGGGGVSPGLATASCRNVELVTRLPCASVS